VTDGGGNVLGAARRLVSGSRADLAPRARICVSHTLQLFLKYFWYCSIFFFFFSQLLTCDDTHSLHDANLQTALGIVNFFAFTVRASQKAREQIGGLVRSISVR
jgi:hypothetical protein